MTDSYAQLVSLMSDPEFDGLPGENDKLGWERLYVRASEEGLCGLADRALETLGGYGACPVRSMFASERCRVRSINDEAMRRAAGIADRFGAAGVDVMLLKGAALIATLYGDPGLRPMCDVDLLIRPGDADRADELLVELGFRRGRPLLRRDFFPRFHYEAEYVSAGPRPLRLDVHVRPWRPLRYGRVVPEEALWAAAREVHIHGASARVPSVGNMLVHLTCHSAFHGNNRLLWLVDIDRFIRNHFGELDWSASSARLDAWSLGHAACAALRATTATLRTPLPEGLIGELARRTGWRDRLAVRQAPRDCESPIRHTVVDLLCTPGWRHRLGYLSAVMLPDDTHLAEHYAGRHWGWRCAAHALRAVSRLRAPVERARL